MSSTTSNFTKLQSNFPDKEWQQNALLAEHTYMKVGGPAEVLWVATNLDELVAVVLFARQHDIPLTVLGGASNVVIKDEGLAGLVIINRCDQLKWYETDHLPTDQLDQEVDTSKTWFSAESGIKTAVLVGQTAQHNLTGLEPFLGVPGTLGGAIYNNSHYRSELIGDYIQAVEIIDEQNQRRWLSRSQCQFGYDDSRFQQRSEIILRGLFALDAGSPEQIQQLMRESTRQRAATQPLGTANSGCMFKNVELNKEQAEKFEGRSKLSAGWLIDQAGLKGLRVGDAVVSTKHANFIVNEGQASSEDIKKLTDLIIKKVQEKFGIVLEREVFFIGKERL